MKVRLNSKLADRVLPKDFTGICLWPFGLYWRSGRISLRDFNHEAIHWEQQKELLGFFYILYGINWLVEVIKMKLGGDEKCYKDIVFEKEANNNEEDEDYLQKRKKFGWIKYL